MGKNKVNIHMAFIRKLKNKKKNTCIVFYVSIRINVPVLIIQYITVIYKYNIKLFINVIL